MSDALPRRRRSGGLYPLWLGGLALAGFTALWLGVHDAGGEPGPDAGFEEPPVPHEPAPAEPSRIIWQIGPRPPMDPAALDDCLAGAGLERALVVGSDPMLITHPARLRPLRLSPIEVDDQPAIELSTPVEADVRLAATLHVATTACLYLPGAAVRDPKLDRVLSDHDWPQLGASGGLPVHHLIAVDDVPGGLRTRGLMRLDRPELGLVVGAGDRAAALRFIQAYAAAAVVASPDAERLDRGGGFFARPILPAEARVAGWWAAPANADVGLRVLAEDSPGLPRPVALPRPQPNRPPSPQPPPAARTPAAESARPPPARRPPAARPTPRPPKRAAPEPVPFKPAYR